MDEPTRNKFVVLTGGEAQRRALLERFAPDQLAQEFGGSAPSLLGYRERAILEYERTGASGPVEGDDEALSEEERELRAAEALGRCHDWYTGVKAALRQTEG
jgi:hypothetical protein